jgi:hypothetical protein
MWALKVKHSDGHEELLGPFMYQSDALLYSIDRLDKDVEVELVLIKPPSK